MDKLTRDVLEMMAAHYEAANSGERDKWLVSLSNWSLTRSWAWDALLAILGGHRARGEVAPPLLTDWTQLVALRALERPRDGRRASMGRDLMAEVLFDFFRDRGLGITEAQNKAAEAFRELGSSGDAVRKIIEKRNADRPF